MFDFVVSALVLVCGLIGISAFLGISYCSGWFMVCACALVCSRFYLHFGWIWSLCLIGIVLGQCFGFGVIV